MNKPASTNARGYTLIELLIGIVVLAILTSVALPSFRDFTRRNAVTTQANAVLADLQYARSDAITRRVVTDICSSTSGTACLASNGYDGGWLVYHETAPGPTATFSATKDEVLRVSQAKQGVSIRLLDSSTGSAVNTIGFDQQGALLGGKDVDFLVCAIPGGASIGQSTAQVKGADLKVSASGRTTVRQMAAGDSCGS